MAKTLLLKAEIREQTGSRAVQKVRKQGRIPAIVYGHKQTPVAISLDAHNFVECLHHGHRLMDVQIDKKKEKVLVKDLQYDYLSKNIIHADLIRVDITETVRVEVPIELKGAANAKGTQEGGIIEEHTDHLEVECKATDIPEALAVPVKEMEVGDAIHAGDIELPEGVKLVSSPEILLVTCHLVSVAKTTEEVEEEMPSAPEVISEAEKSEEEGEQEQAREEENK
jgi:large subunit ribosomal protein L25